MSCGLGVTMVSRCRFVDCKKTQSSSGTDAEGRGSCECELRVDGKSLAALRFPYAPKTALKIKSKTHNDGAIIITHCLNMLCIPANQSPLTRDMCKVPWVYLHSTHLCFVLSSEAGSHVVQADHRTPYLAEDDFELLTFLSLSL